jgi:uncharacterized RDD family membrane protein YckC
VTAISSARKSLLAPEGVVLPFEIPSVADRIAAFAVDFFVIHAGVAVVTLAGFLLAGFGFGEYALSTAMLASFVLRNFYFVALESRWGGATVGKRHVGLRVISRDGGPLTAEAVLARNLTRDFETFLPLTALAAPGSLIPGVPGWAALLGCLWLIVFALLPAAGKEGLRVGDLVAGTIVVRMPKARLLADLASGRPRARRAAPEAEPIAFTQEQLDLYGIRELQVLEELLRREPGAARDELLEAVAAKIKRKIRWPRERAGVDTVAFLTAFYKAQRGRLEEKMLFGVRQDRKVR